MARNVSYTKLPYSATGICASTRSRWARVQGYRLHSYVFRVVFFSRLTVIPTQGTLPFRSALSLRCPTKPYQLSDDIESFVHVFHHLVLRFAETAHSDNLRGWVNFFCEPNSFVEDTEGRRVQIGGKAKLRYIVDGYSPVQPLRNRTLTSILVKLASICAEHYRTINIVEMERRYAPNVVRKLSPTNMPAVLNRRELKKRKQEEVDRGSRSSVLNITLPQGRTGSASPAVATSPTVSLNPLKSIISSQPTTTPSEPVPAASSADQADSSGPSGKLNGQTPVPPISTLSTHDALLELFRQYGEDLDGNLFDWPEEDLDKTNDQFQAANLVPSRNNVFSLSTAPGMFPSNPEQPEQKRRKGMNGSALESVGETAEEVAE